MITENLLQVIYVLPAGIVPTLSRSILVQNPRLCDHVLES